MPAEDFEHQDDIIYVSKSEMKRDMLALQELGEALIPLDKKLLATLNLPEKLYDALIEAKRLTAHGAISRQKQYIGKLIRNVDPAPIRELLDKIAGVSDRHSAWLHRLERLREQLMTDPKALEKLLEECPTMDIQRMRQLVRNAQKEREQTKPPKAFREIFQLLKEYIPEPPIPGLTKVTDTDEQTSE
ncbi:ribosome biogenesis factor YjgA [Formivibrio citricus]|nr:ribosome biogenesis factor YjgA [Formivibrio citricus]